MIDRQKHWNEVIEPDLKTVLRKKNIASLKRVYEGEEFDPRTEEFDFLNLRYQDLFFLRPDQNKEVWKKFFLADQLKWRKRKHDLDGVLSDSLSSYSGSGFDLSYLYGWEWKTELEYHEFIFGKNFIDGEYDFFGHIVEYPTSPIGHYSEWIRLIFWYINDVANESLNGVPIPNKNKWVYFRDFALESIHYINANAFLKPKGSGQKRMSRITIKVLKSLSDFSSVENLTPEKEENLLLLKDSFLKGTNHDVFDGIIAEHLR